jgi:hypothetical protein
MHGFSACAPFFLFATRVLEDELQFSFNECECKLNSPSLNLICILNDENFYMIRRFEKSNTILFEPGMNCVGDITLRQGYQLNSSLKLMRSVLYCKI